MKVCKWARKQGAVQIKVDGIEILFPPPDLEEKPKWPKEGRQGPYHDGGGETWREMLHENQVTENAPPAIRSAADDPDLFARDSDVWANQTRLPRR